MNEKFPLKTTELYRIVTPYFVAGVIISKRTEKIIETAPILNWVLNRHISFLCRWCFRRVKPYLIENIDA